MHREPLLTAIPSNPVRSLAEIFALAQNLARTAEIRYGQLAARTDHAFWPVRCVFEVLTARERSRAAAIDAAGRLACDDAPSQARLTWRPPDLIADDEISELEASALASPYAAWALAVRHRQRAFVFWTYVAAPTNDARVQAAAEDFAREALNDGALLRTERRRAWRNLRRAPADDATLQAGTLPPSSAPLLETLLTKDLAIWSHEMTADERRALTAAMPYPQPVLSAEAARPSASDLQAAKARALRRAEQLANLYLDEADHAVDHGAMELAQNMAAQSIRRLAALRSAVTQVV